MGDMSAMIIRDVQRKPDFVQGGSNMTGTDLCVNKPPTTSLFLKGHQEASRTLEKMC
jgi:hypothetical protein